MTKYIVTNSKGDFPTEDVESEEPAPPPSQDAANDSAVAPSKPHPLPTARPKAHQSVLNQGNIDKAKNTIKSARQKMGN